MTNLEKIVSLKSNTPKTKEFIKKLKKEEEEILTKLVLSKISFDENTISQFINYFSENQSKFRVLHNLKEVQIFLIKGEVNHDLINIFNTIEVPFDLLYFKNAIFNRENWTIDISFDALSRCQPDVSKKLVSTVFSKLSIN